MRIVMRGAGLDLRDLPDRVFGAQGDTGTRDVFFELRVPSRTTRATGFDYRVRPASARRRGRPRARRRRDEEVASRLVTPALMPSGVYAGSTSLSFEVFGRHRGRARSLEPCDFARLCASRDDS
jgi:hypothetical protein